MLAAPCPKKSSSLRNRPLPNITTTHPGLVRCNRHTQAPTRHAHPLPTYFGRELVDARATHSTRHHQLRIRKHADGYFRSWRTHRWPPITKPSGTRRHSPSLPRAPPTRRCDFTQFSSLRARLPAEGVGHCPQGGHPPEEPSALGDPPADQHAVLASPWPNARVWNITSGRASVCPLSVVSSSDQGHKEGTWLSVTARGRWIAGAYGWARQ